MRKVRVRQKRKKAKETEMASGKAKTRGDQPAPLSPETSNKDPWSCLADWKNPWMQLRGKMYKTGGKGEVIQKRKRQP